jgi:hypothetical protein
LPLPHLDPTQARPRAAAIATLAAAAVALSACGGSSNASTQQSQGQAQRGPFASLSAEARSCLQKQGITPPNGQRPGNGQPPTGQRPSGGQRPANGARFQKLRAAMQKCGVQLPARPPGGGAPQGATGGTGTTQSQ